MIPFFIALLITYILAPLVQWIQDKGRAPRLLAIVITGVLIIFLMVGIALILTANIKGMIVSFNSYADRVDAIVLKASELISLFGIDQSHLGKDQLTSAIKPFFSFASVISKAMLDLLADSFLILVFVLFLISGSKFELPDTPFFRETDQRIRSYLITKVLTSLATGGLTAFCLWVIGLELAFLFGLLAFLLNFIPTVGSVIAVILPLPVALLSLPSGGQVALVMLIPGAIQFVVGNVVEPKIMGDSLDLHPVTLLLALMFWGLLWNVPGMLLAAPLTVIAKVALARTKSGHMISELMAGRFDLNPEGPSLEGKFDHSKASNEEDHK